MADLTEQLSSLLSDPEGMSRLRAMAEGLLGGDGAPKKNDEPPSPASQSSDSSLGIDPAAIAKLAGALAINREDDRINLLKALRPHLSPEKQKRVDMAVKMIKLLEIAPRLRELGIFEV